MSDARRGAVVSTDLGSALVSRLLVCSQQRLGPDVGEARGVVRGMRTLHDAFVTVCARKIAYDEAAEAEAVAERLMRESPYDEILNVYRCPFAPLGEGGHFHVGHARGTKPNRGTLRARRRWSRPRITFSGPAPDTR